MRRGDLKKWWMVLANYMAVGVFATVAVYFKCSGEKCAEWLSTNMLPWITMGWPYYVYQAFKDTVGGLINSGEAASIGGSATYTTDVILLVLLAVIAVLIFNPKLRQKYLKI